jgi:flagellar biosynthesis protein FlhG
MRDFYASSAPMPLSAPLSAPLSTPQSAPLDQADGLRRMFSGRRRHVLALAANPHVPFAGVVMDRLASVLAASRREVLVVDAASTSPAPHELAGVDLAACIEPLSPRVSYLAARGLPRAHIDTRGSAGGFIDALLQAAPQADVVLLHADGADLVRLFKLRGTRPMLLGADHPESIKHAYANAKLLASRSGLMTFDLLLTVAPHSPRAAAIASSLAGCAESFLGATLVSSALIDPAGDPAEPADPALAALLSAQLALDEAPDPATVRPGTSPDARHDSRTAFR